jgi:hypothetical protein
MVQQQPALSPAQHTQLAVLLDDSMKGCSTMNDESDDDQFHNRQNNMHQNDRVKKYGGTARLERCSKVHDCCRRFKSHDQMMMYEDDMCKQQQQYPHQKGTVRFVQSTTCSYPSTSSQLSQKSSGDGSCSSCDALVVHIQECLHRDDYTEEEKKATWYSSDELSMIRCARKILIRLLDRNAKDIRKQQQQQQQQQKKKNLWTTTMMDTERTTMDNVLLVDFDCDDDDDDVGMCTDSSHTDTDKNNLSSVRGLERMSKQGRRRRHLHTRALMDAVMTAQESQYERGVHDENAIAYICEMYTRQSGMEARRRGVVYEQEATRAAAVVAG